MFCINCFHQKTHVVNSRGHKKNPQIWRRRLCPNCAFAFTTYENFALDELLLIQKKDNNSPYNRGKLIASVIESLRPTGDDLSDAYWLMLTIEQKLISSQKSNDQWRQILSSDLANIIYETLVSYNTVAGYTYGAAHGLIAVSQKRRRGRKSITEN